MDKGYNILLVNGSPHSKGCVARAFDELERTLNENGVATTRINIGNKNIRGCIACNFCRTHGKCVFDDAVNETAPLLAEADGLIVGTPVYYAGPNGQLHAFLDRLFYSTSGSVDCNQKIGATVVSSRRAGSTSAFDDLNHFFTMNSMPVVSSTYWNEVHGFTAEDVESDLEGLQTIRNLGRNAAFLVKAIRAQKERDGLPVQEHEHFTSFFAERR
ncbi:MAG: flavodoxin family protein [Muribaculaceae bacterium]|nr:flavodoxin family protein [Muribaculaceae bacterium]